MITEFLSPIPVDFDMNLVVTFIYHARMRNVEAAEDVGIVGLHFKNADSLRQDLSLLGIDI